MDTPYPLPIKMPKTLASNTLDQACLRQPVERSVQKKTGKDAAPGPIEGLILDQPSIEQTLDISCGMARPVKGVILEEDLTGSLDAGTLFARPSYGCRVMAKRSVSTDIRQQLLRENQPKNAVFQ